ncbi:MAG: hypothetical protein KDE59_25775 [Anaerolineales bacterium]|nr:hypothetical protein [Anaerolineales bacterium]
MQRFDWRLYADATFAGLAVLIPIPIVDALFEEFFRRRMPRVIARVRNRAVSPETLKALGDGDGCTPAGCLLWPFKQLFNLLVKISRKILYFLTIKEATDKLSYYWHRAFLIDFMLANGYLGDDRPVFVARAALNRTLTDVETSPVIQLAQQVVGNSHHILRSLWRVARRKEEDDMLSDQASLIGRRWSEYSDYWDKLSDRYRLIYETEHSLWQRAQQEAAATAEEE